MVKKHDFDLLKSQNEAHPEKFSPAPTLDRLAAFIVDSMITIPFFKIFAFKTIQALRLSIGFELTYTIFTSLFNIIWIMFTILMVYQFITYKIFGKTLGQYLFKIQIIHTNSFKPINLFTLIQRNILFYLSFPLIFPFFSVLLEKNGRTFYDKILSTLVVSQRESSSRFRFAFPANKVFSASLILIGFIFLSGISLLFMTQSFKFKSDFKNSDQVCEKINRYHSKWSQRDVHETRLEVAIALYSAGELSTKCLNQEINFEVALNNESPEAYFAKALLNAENKDLAMDYFHQVCQINTRTPICEIVTWITYWPNSFEGEHSSASEYKKPMLYHVWSIKRNFSKGSIFRLKHNLKSFPVLNGLESFYAEHLMYLNFFKKNTGSIQNILKVAEHSSSKNKNLKEKYCALAVSESCENFKNQPFCLSLDVNKTVDSHLKNMIYSCAQKPNQVFSSQPLKSKFYKKLALKELLQADQMKQLFKNPKESFPFRLAVLNTFLSSVKNHKYLKTTLKDWVEFSEKDYFWRIWGEKLKAKFKISGDTQGVFRIYKTLGQEYKEPISTPLVHPLPFINRRQPAQEGSANSIPPESL